MSEYAGRSNLPGYVSIKEAARILGISDKRVYEYVDEGRLSSMWAADVIMIPLDEVQQFKRKSAGRPRKNIPTWRISIGDNTQYVTTVVVQIRKGQQNAFLQKLEEIRLEGKHTFPGTVARSIIKNETVPDTVEIELVWRQSLMPAETERMKALETFRQELEDVLDWDSAHYYNGTVLMHT